MTRGDIIKISVIIPILNAERWISQQLDSLLAQTADAEKLVINSGLTDAMRSLVRVRADCVRPLEIPDENLSHGGTRSYALQQEYWYNERNSKVMEQYRNQLSGTKADAGGWRMLRFAGGGLSREERVGELPGFFARVCVRFAGN